MRFLTYGKLSAEPYIIKSVPFGHIYGLIIYMNNLETFLGVHQGALIYYFISLSEEVLCLQQNERHLRAYFGMLITQL